MMALTDAALAAHLAGIAGKIALQVQACGLIIGRALGEAGDQTVNQYLVHALIAQRPDDGLLSEERQDSDARLSRGRVWIIDPVDGSREYGEGRTDWAVHVGLAIDGVARIGAVALPGLDQIYRSDRPVALPAIPPAAVLRPRLVVSRSRANATAAEIADTIGAELIAMGSAGAKAMAVVRGDAEIYLHTGGQHEWDSCAPVAVAAAHGLHVSRVDGAPLVYNQPSPYLPDLLICRPQWAERVLGAVSARARRSSNRA